VFELHFSDIVVVVLYTNEAPSIVFEKSFFIVTKILIEMLEKRKQNHCCNHPQGTHQRKTGKSFFKKKQKKLAPLQLSNTLTLKSSN
jgi:hypothetical protein